MAVSTEGAAGVILLSVPAHELNVRRKNNSADRMPGDAGQLSSAVTGRVRVSIFIFVSTQRARS